MNQICKQCGIEYDAKTQRSRYCSHRCRAISNKVAQPDFAQPESSGVAQPGGMTPEGWAENLPPRYGEPDCACLHCQQNDGKKVLNHGSYKRSSDLGENEINRVSLPGDVDYCGCMEVNDCIRR